MSAPKASPFAWPYEVARVHEAHEGGDEQHRQREEEVQLHDGGAHGILAALHGPQEVEEPRGKEQSLSVDRKHLITTESIQKSFT